MAEAGPALAKATGGGPAGPGTARAAARGVWIVAALILFLVASMVAFTQAPHPRIEGRGVVESLLYPIERNPADRLARVGRQLNKISMAADGMRAIAVGNGGTIVTSRDGGQSWTAQTSGTTNALYGVSLSSDGQRAVAIGDDGVILTSGDGGARWAAQTSGTTEWLQDVSLSSDGQRAVAVGVGGVILTSSDGGARWAAKTSGTTEWLYGVSLSSDGQRAVAVGMGGVILTSSDGGASWAAQTSGTTEWLTDVSLSSDGQRAVAVGVGGVILTSSDGGESWAAQTSDTTNQLNGVALSSDGRRAVAVGLDGVILTSSNGGASWATQASGTTNLLWGVSVSSDGQHAVAVGVGGVILTSGNGGGSWNVQTSGTTNQLNGVALSNDGQRAVAVGVGGTIVTSRDAGQSWTAQTSGTTERLTDVSLSSDGQRAVAVGDGGVILTSGNGGGSWNVQTSDTANILYGVSLSSDGQRAVAVGVGGTIVTSRDAGQSWTAQSSGTTERLTDVSLSSDGQRAVAVGDGGVILTSSNGGGRWTAQTSGTTEWLLGVSLSSDGQRAVGGGGVILTSNDGGARWAAQTSGATEWLRGVSLSSDGQSAVAIGDDGVILTSSNGGAAWIAQTSGTTERLRGVSLSSDGQRAVAVGDSGTILTSSDGGQSWIRRSLPRTTNYARYPAPWYYLTLLICGLILFRAFSGTPQPPQTGAAAIAASDAPTTSPDQDRLDFVPLARGISRFLRNANTEPPLTLAITGEWGTGKSSLMGLVCADLRANRWRPVWFNAWHHQNEEQLLAALLVSVRESGVPPLLSLGGLGFRWNLLWIRANRHPLATLLVLAISSMIGYFLLRHNDGSEWQGLVAMATPLIKGEFGASELGALSSLVPVLGTIGVVTIIGRTIKAFGVDPAVLLSSTMAKFRLKDASAQTSFRMRFAEQFRDVTQVLAYPMVIVIDDLDRCQSETVLEVMEAVNFLTSSGKCFVIFGMATQRVQAALALSFKEIAGEFVALDSKEDVAEGSPSEQALARKQRQEYARQYLEKLINIEIVVPDRSDLPPSQLLEARTPAPRTRLAGAVAWAKRWQLVPPAVLAMAGGIWLASLISLPEVPKAPPEQVNKEASVAPDKPAAQPTPAAPRATPAAAPPVAQAPVITPGSDRNISLLWFIGALAALIAAGALFWLRWYQRQRIIVNDSQAFDEAMKIWSPVASFSRSSPRSIKRFGNRIRYLAMLQQGEQLDEPPLAERLLDGLANGLTALRQRLRPVAGTAAAEASEAAKDKATEDQRALALSEHRVVALGAMHAHFGTDWRDIVESPSASAAYAQVSESGSDFRDKYVKAVAAYRAETGASWPPSPDELDAFERSLKGVRLPGDGRTFDTSIAAAAASGANEPAETPLSPQESLGIMNERVEDILESLSEVATRVSETGQALNEKVERSRAAPTSSETPAPRPASPPRKRNAPAKT